MAQIQSFLPLIGESPKCLVLGSIPGIASIEQQQYYGHPRNAFWPIMQNYFQWPSELNYAQRTTALTQNGVALWDVLSACERVGSLDSAIKPGSMIVNNIAALLDEHASIQAVLLNGGKAAKEFKRHVTLCGENAPKVFQLPSTSPAYAAMPYIEKQRQWHKALDDFHYNIEIASPIDAQELN